MSDNERQIDSADVWADDNKLMLAIIGAGGTILGFGLIFIAALALVMSMTGCTSLGGRLPDPPKGQFCSHFQPSAKAVCSDISTNQALPSVPISQTDKWIMIPPQTWEKIQNYIDELILIIEQKSAFGAEVDLMTLQGEGKSSHRVYLTASEIRALQSRIKDLRRKTLRRP